MEGPNGARASATSDERLYRSLKRVVAVRSVAAVLLVGASLAAREPKLGFDLVLGGVCGIVNMLLVMRANERLLAGRARMGNRAATSIVRIFGVGGIALWTATLGPLLGMATFFAGFFTPLLFSVIELQRRYKSTTGKEQPR